MDAIVLLSWMFSVFVFVCLCIIIVLVRKKNNNKTGSHMNMGKLKIDGWEMVFVLFSILNMSII